MLSRVAFTSSLLVLGAGLARASISLSSQCQSALLGIAGSSEADCLNVGGLVGLLTTSQNASLVAPINTWLTGACAQDPCSNQTLSDITSNITSGCSSDLSSVGISNSTNLTSIVQEAYPTVRKIACLKETSNNSLCVTSLLTEVESAEGTPVSLQSIMSLLPSIVNGQATSLPTYITCSDCVKQAYTVLKTDQPSIASNATVSNALTSQCGSSFIDGSAASDIAEGTGSAAPSGSGSTSGAAGFMSGGALTGIALSSLAAVSSAFFVLA